MLIVLIAAELIFDPFDKGLLGAPVRGLPDYGPRFTDASRARDAAFSGAILGNSRIQLVDPAALTAASGIPFVSLIVPGTGPREQFAILDYLLRHRGASERALVFGLDDSWCTDDPALPILHPFPFWLYGTGPKALFDELIRYLTLEHSLRTAALRLGFGQRARPDGYWNYAHDRFHPEGATFVDLAEPVFTTPQNVTNRFPALEGLSRRLDGLSRDTRVVLVRPPVFHTALPPAESALGRAEAACRDAMARTAAEHPGAVLVDLRTDRPETQNPEEWFDHTHYKEPVARWAEAEIGAALTGATAPPPPESSPEAAPSAP